MWGVLESKEGGWGGGGVGDTHRGSCRGLSWSGPYRVGSYLGQAFAVFPLVILESRRVT